MFEKLPLDINKLVLDYVITDVSYVCCSDLLIIPRSTLEFEESLRDVSKALPLHTSSVYASITVQADEQPLATPASYRYESVDPKFFQHPRALGLGL
jgi:hypothetical protein